MPDAPTSGDPHIVWFFEELRLQALSLTGIAQKAGISHTTAFNMKTKQEIKLSSFKYLLEVLGYEIKIVPKENKDV